MVRTLRHMLLVLLAALSFSSCSGSDEDEVIPRSTLAKIYAEMLVTDQWIISTPGIRMIADTSLVYQPILEKYGYDIHDYTRTIDEYMNDPERFSRILRSSAKIIGHQLKDAEARLAEYQRLQSLPKIKSDFDPSEFFPYIFDEPYVHYYDSITFKADSARMVYRLIHIERTDTVFDGVRMTVREDSFMVEEPLLQEDTLEVQQEKPLRNISTSGLLKRSVMDGDLRHLESEVEKK